MAKKDRVRGVMYYGTILRFIDPVKLENARKAVKESAGKALAYEDRKQVLQFDRTGKWVKKNLINQFQVIVETPEYMITHTGLHELEFIETRVLEIRTVANLPSDGEMVMANLVEGQEAVIESKFGEFDPFVVHCAETFILPACCGDCIIRPLSSNAAIKVLLANVRDG